MTVDTPEKSPPITPEQAAQIVSRQLGLPQELEAVRALAERVAASVNQNPTLRAAGPEGLKAFIWAITPEDPARMDPAKQAEAMLARANITSSDGVVWGKVLENFRAVSSGNISREESERRRSEASLAAVDIGQITNQNWDAAGGIFKSAGLDYGTFDKLRRQGFNAQQIISAAGLSKELKIDVNVNTGAIARLQRDVPGVETGLRTSRDNWQAVGHIEDEARKARERGDHTRAAELEKKGQEVRERAEQHDSEQREHVQRVRPERLPDLQTVQGHIKAAGLHLDAATSDAKPADAQEMRRAFDAAQRNPGDVDAQQRYQRAKAKFGDKPGSSRRFAQAEAEWKKQAAIRDVNQEQRNEKKADTTQTVQRSDAKEILKAEAVGGLNDGVNALFGNDSESAPKQKDEETPTPAPKPTRPTKVATNTRAGKKASPQQG